MELTIDNANILVIFGCERDIFAETTKQNITINMSSSTNINGEKFNRFARMCNNKRQSCKIILKNDVNRYLYSSEKIW